MIVHIYCLLLVCTKLDLSSQNKQVKLKWKRWRKTDVTSQY